MNQKTRSTLLAAVAGMTALGLFNGLVYGDHRHTAKHKKPAYAGDDCVRYEIRSFGGDAGLRFMHNIGNYTLVRKGIAHGRLCYRGPTTVELSRRHPHTKVVLKIDGQRHVFRPHEPAHRYINHWHRKYVDLSFPRAYKKHKKAYRHAHKNKYRDRGTEQYYYPGHGYRGQGYHHGYNRTHRRHQHWW